MTDQGPIEVYVAKDLIEAQFVCDLLNDAGIGARIVGEPLGMVVGKIPALEASPRIWVHSHDVERARPLIDAYWQRVLARVRRVAGISPGEEPVCYHCGQAVSRGHSPCPVCGLELDWAEGS